MTDYQKLEAIYNEIDTLIANNVMAESPEFESWHSRAERFLVNRFGRNSYEVGFFQYVVFTNYVCARCRLYPYKYLLQRIEKDKRRFQRLSDRN